MEVKKNYVIDAKVENNNENIEPEKQIFSGIHKFTTIDDFGHIGAILFTGGCNFRCSYCHNPGFVLPERVRFLPNEEIVNFLKNRIGLIESIIICGGEPTIHPSLIDWIKYIKSLGYRIKLDTNATNTNMFRQIIDENLVDFIAIDYKASKSDYSKIICRNFDVNLIVDNLRYLADSDMEYEIRTTVHPDLHSKKDIFKMIDELKKIGIKNYYLQVFKMPPQSVGEVRDVGFEKGFFDEIKGKLESNFEKSGIRNLD